MMAFKKHGFTLVELLAALAIMAIVATLAVAAFGKLATSKGVDGAASKLQGQLRAIRGHAIAYHGEAGLVLTQSVVDGRQEVRLIAVHRGNSESRWFPVPDANIMFLPKGAKMDPWDKAIRTTSSTSTPFATATPLDLSNVELGGQGTLANAYCIPFHSNGHLVSDKPQYLLIRVCNAKQGKESDALVVRVNSISGEAKILEDSTP